MKLLYISAELYPYVKTGGLGDVAASLPPSLSKQGIDIRYLLPGYAEITNILVSPKKITTLHWNGMNATLLLGRLPNGLHAYVIDAPEYYHRANPYTYADGADWPDNHLRFGLLCHTAAHLAQYDAKWQPDILHGHDWHCGLIPAYIAHSPEPRPATVLTIHNIAYQGLFPHSVLQDLRLPPECFSVYGLEYHGQVGFLKAGIYYADSVTTVSPTYAGELKTAEYGHGLQGLISDRENMAGILNGIDQDIWNPATDKNIDTSYDATSLALKKNNKTALCTELGMDPKKTKLLLGAISRLTPQKGFDILLDCMPALLEKGVSFAILGKGDAAIEAKLADIAAQWPGKIGLRLGYDETLAHRIQAGCDAILVPSAFEPCGLVQMYGLRYGTLPVVRKTGGLADTVRDQETGFVFDHATQESLQDALDRLQAVYKKPATWKKMQRQAMAENFGWDTAAKNYIDLYRRLFGDNVIMLPKIA